MNVYFYVLFMYVYFILKQGTMEENSMVQPVYIYIWTKKCACMWKAVRMNCLLHWK